MGSSRSEAGERSNRKRRKSDNDDGSSRKKKRSSSDVEIIECMKKALKVAKKKFSGYSNYSNHSNLGENFVWGRKIDISTRREMKRHEAEMDKMKKRREERAFQKAQREEQMALLSRQCATIEFQDWEKREQEFHFNQSKLRSQIRLREGRMKPIDILLSKKIEPYNVFRGLTVKEMEELRDDIKMHLDSDRATPTHIQFWEAMMVVCNWELAEARKRDALDRARIRGPEILPQAQERGLHSSIEADVKSHLEGKNSNQLESMEQRIVSQMCSGSAKVVEFWEAVLKRLHIYKAKAQLKEIHASVLRKPRLEQTEEGLTPQLIWDEPRDEPKAQEEKEEEEEEGKHQRRIQKVMVANKAATPEGLELKAIKAMGVMEEGDTVFGSGAEVNLDLQVYQWHDRYHPQKPKYFNRVHTGYEWNKYNQTHYDQDNPPPKIVQGYKFNIFYPDLVDKTKAPTYTIEEDASGETCIIRFHAGPPYAYIAFRIVNKEWECSQKKGFKHTFEQGVLRVYFNFKRYRYRR